jgi:hypothetical protein
MMTFPATSPGSPVRLNDRPARISTPAISAAAFERTVRGDVTYRFVIDCTKF